VDYYSESRRGLYHNPVVLSGSPRTQGTLAAFVDREAGKALDRAAFRPASLPDDLVTAIALPPIVAGLIIFRLPPRRCSRSRWQRGSSD
jgi:hypothetical protein